MSRNKIIIINIIALLVTLSSLITVTYGKYVYNSIYEKYLEANNFYFDSDILSLDGKDYELKNWNEDMAIVVPITLKNYDNDYAFSDENINFSVEMNCPSTINCVTDLSGNIGTIEGKAKKEKTFNLTVTMNDELQNGDIVKFSITVKSTKPYQKKLTANFTVQISDFSYLIEDKANQHYFLLQLLNSKDQSHVYHLSFDPSLFSIDMTNDLVLNASNKQYKNNYISGLDISVDANTSIEIIFYKNDPTKDYTYPIINNTPIITIK